VPAAREAVADLRDAGGAIIGTVQAVERGPDSTIIRVTLTRPLAGMRGAHLHAVGQCDGPAFTAAGDHLNPAGRRHGLRNPSGPHAGDLPNLEGARLTYTIPVPLATVLDADGSALVIHQSSDDQRADPSGNSGPRIACAALGAPARGGGRRRT